MFSGTSAEPSCCDCIEEVVVVVLVLVVVVVTSVLFHFRFLLSIW